MVTGKARIYVVLMVRYWSGHAMDTTGIMILHKKINMWGYDMIGTVGPYWGPVCFI